jgi:hypothetical protein
MVLIIIGAALGLLFVARTILSARSANRTPTFIDQVIVLAVVVVVAMAVVQDNQTVNALDIVEFGFIALGLTFALFGLIAIILGRHSGSSSKDARGFLAIGIGLVVIAIAFFIPQLNNNMPSPTEVAFVMPTAINDVADASASSNTLSNQRFTNSRSVNPAPTQTPVNLVQVIPSPVPPDLYFFTPTPTPVGLACNGVIEANLNLRKYPTVAEGNIVGLAPINKAVLITGRTEATSWYYVEFDIYEGWVDANYVDAEDACATIPTRAWAE